MSHINTIFHQLLRIFPRHQFDKLVRKHHADRYVKYYTTWQQFITLLYAQIKGKDSLRDIELAFKSHPEKSYHLGILDVKRSTLSDANNNRDYRVFEGLFYALLDKCDILTPPHKFQFKNRMYSIDSTTIDLCLSAFPWAKFRKKKGAIKMHCLFNHSGSLPSFINITEGKTHDVTALKNQQLPVSADSIISVDRAYIDYKWLNSLNQQGVFFVTRAKKDLKFRLIGQHEVDKSKGLKFDQTVVVANASKRVDYPDDLRLVGYTDPETLKEYTFMTNIFHLDAFTITQIYKQRWQIELFFKWIKQNLKIKSFLGTSKNAVLTQIWVAMCYYLLLSFVKFQTKYSYSMLELARIFNNTLLTRINIIELLSFRKYHQRIREPAYQNTLFF
jgi:hypothetical protein